jgi:hypothetical protein
MGIAFGGTLNCNLDPQSFARALDYVLGWQWLAIAVWGWGLIWLVDGFPRFADHLVLTGIASFATIMSVFKAIHYIQRRLRRLLKPVSYD